MSPPPTRRNLSLVPLALILSLWISPVRGQLAYTGGTVVQDFDSLPAYGEFILPGKGPFALDAPPFSASGLTGWYVYQNAGNPLRFLPDDGTDGLSSFYSAGQIGSEDRALGHLSASSRGGRFVWILRNDTGSELTSFSLSFTGEQWRNGGSSIPNSVKFYHQTSNSLPDPSTGAGWTEESTLIHLSPTRGPGGGALDGNAPANRVELFGMVSGISWQAGEFLMLRWQDFDESGSDDLMAIDNVLFHSLPTGNPPSLVASMPGDGESHVSPLSIPELVFDEPVFITAGGITLSGSLSGPLAATVTGGPQRFAIEPQNPLPSGETITISLAAASITNAADTPMAANDSVVFSIASPDTVVTKIHAVQGSGGTSPLQGVSVTVQGVVVADFQGAFPNPGGFYLQEEAADTDADPETSEGIFIFDRDMPVPVDVAVGDIVRVTGPVAEYLGLTEIATPTAVSVMGSAPLPDAISVAMPVGGYGALERYEGMRVEFPDSLSVTGSESLGSQGRLELSSGGPLLSPTERVDPNDDPAAGTSAAGVSNLASVLAARDANRFRTIVLDDASDEFFPDPTPYLNTGGTRRTGDTVTGLTGVLGQTGFDQVLLPTAPVVFTDANPRPAAPTAKRERIRVATMNVLNYFLTLNDRGASDAAELARQKEKIVSALVALDADVIGLVELENGTAARDDLLASLNTAAAPVVYAAVTDPPAGSGGDAIRTAFFYRTGAVTPTGAAILDTDPIWFGANPLRPPLAQLFEETSSGEGFIVCVNHFKSKASTGSSNADLDQGDGQGSFNDLRRQLANRLVAFLGAVSSSYSESDILVVGDLNAYGEEDPIDILRANGWTDELARFASGTTTYRRGTEGGRLDHAFSSASLAPKVVEASTWAINADEPPFLDYNLENKSPAQQALNATGPYRSSDHDPVIVDLFAFDFDYWQSTRISWNGADNTPGGDPNRNGIPNVAEFFHGSDPLAANGEYPGPFVTRTGTDLEITWHQRRDTGDVSAVPQWSENLVDWFPMNSATEISSLDAVRVEMKSTIPHGERTELFGRLLISRP